MTVVNLVDSNWLYRAVLCQDSGSREWNCRHLANEKKEKNKYDNTNELWGSADLRGVPVRLISIP